MSEKCPTSCRMSEMDRADIDLLVEYGVYTHPSDAIKSTLRAGIQFAMSARGIKPARIHVEPEDEVVECTENNLITDSLAE